MAQEDDPCLTLGPARLDSPGLAAASASLQLDVQRDLGARLVCVLWSFPKELDHSIIKLFGLKNTFKIKSNY